MLWIYIRVVNGRQLAKKKRLNNVIQKCDLMTGGYL